jgi:hypothetical protein
MALTCRGESANFFGIAASRAIKKPSNGGRLGAKMSAEARRCLCFVFASRVREVPYFCGGNAFCEAFGDSVE